MKKFFTNLKGALAVGFLLGGIASAAAFPTLNDLNGKEYTFTSEMTPGTATYAGVTFTATSTFSISVMSGVPSLVDFPATNVPSMACNYDESTGILTFQKRYLGLSSITGYIYFAPNGEWVSLSGTPLMTLQFNEDGSEITIPDFDLLKNTSAPFIYYAQYKNCKATSGTGGGEGGGTDDDLDEDSPLAGVWSIASNDPYLDLGPATNNYDVTVTKTGLVTFTLQSENKGTESVGDVFVAQLGSDGTTLTFSKTKLNNVMFPTYEVPFNNGAASGVGVKELNEESFTATFVPATADASASITFAADEATGLRFGNFNTDGSELQNDWQVAFNFISATKVSGFLPELVLSTPLGTDYYTISDNSLIATYDIAAYNFDSSNTYTWNAIVTKSVNQEDEDATTETVEGATVAVDLEKGTATFTIPNLSPAEYSLTLSLTASVNGEVYATSNPRSWVGYVGPSIYVIQPKATVDGTSITYTARTQTYQGIGDSNVLKMEYAPYNDIYPGGTADQVLDNVKEVAATYANGYLSGTLADLEPGTYNYAFRFVAYTSDNTKLVESNWTSASATIEEPTTPKITISNGSRSFDNGTVTITFDAEFENIDTTGVTYSVTASYADASQGGGVKQTATPTVADGKVTVVLTNMPEGNYAIDVTLTVNGADGAAIATSNSISISDYTSGIEGIDVENGNARYFNLNGVEVKNPEKGIYIKVQNGKATKIAR